uniref:Putative ixostatin n=1 Tax=Ixodes ricinus TaxID=34613 RepID=A0A0K8R320_IXORI
MQLKQFMVIIGFTHLKLASARVQSESTSNFDKNMMCLASHFRTTLRRQMEAKCSQIPELKRTLQNVERCRFTCEMKDTSSGHNVVSKQVFRLKDGTPCGYDMGSRCLIETTQILFPRCSRTKPPPSARRWLATPVPPSGWRSAANRRKPYRLSCLVIMGVCRGGECIDILEMNFV